MAIDVSRMSAKDLQVLIRNAQREKTRKEKRKPVATVRKQVERFVRTAGYTIAELFGAVGFERVGKSTAKKSIKKKASPGQRIAPKYRNHADATQTWTGRGRQPRWLAAAIKEGVSLESFRIDASTG